MSTGYTSLGKDEMYEVQVVCHQCGSRVVLDTYCSHCGNQFVEGKNLPVIDAYKDNTTFVVRDLITNELDGCTSQACRGSLFRTIHNDIIQCCKCGRLYLLTHPMHIQNTKSEKENENHE